MGQSWKTKSSFKWGACTADIRSFRRSWKANWGWWRRESPVASNNRTGQIWARRCWNCEQCLFSPNNWGTNCLFTAKTFPLSRLLMLFIYWNHSQIFIDVTLLATIRLLMSPRLFQCILWCYQTIKGLLACLFFPKSLLCLWCAEQKLFTFWFFKCFIYYIFYLCFRPSTRFSENRLLVLGSMKSLFLKCQSFLIGLLLIVCVKVSCRLPYPCSRGQNLCQAAAVPIRRSL